MPERGLTMMDAKFSHLIGAVTGAFGKVSLGWLKAREMVKEYPGCVLVLWFLSFIAGVWL
jgi:hypothetical protein